jgi:hypothetical protein
MMMKTMEAAWATGGRSSLHRRRQLRCAMLQLMQLLVREANNHTLLPIRCSAACRCFLFFSSSSCRRRRLPGRHADTNNPLRRRHIHLRNRRRRRHRRCHYGAVERSARPCCCCCCCCCRNGSAEERPSSPWGAVQSPQPTASVEGLLSLLRQPTESAQHTVVRRRTPNPWSLDVTTKIRLTVVHSRID